MFMNSSEQESANLSISHGDALPSSVLTMTLSEILVRAAAYETGITIKSDPKTKIFLSYSDLLRDAEAILSGLRQKGLQPKDRVILYLRDTRCFFAGLWGCFLGGFVPIPLSVDLNFNSSKLHQTWELCQSPLIITDSDIKDLKAIALKSLLANEPDGNWHCSQLDDLALLLFTSGSTGKPKGVMLSARNLLASVYGMAKVNNLSQQDITLNWMPIEHVASLVMFHLTEVYLGCQQIQVKSELILQNPLQWLDLIDRYRVTATWSPNFAYNLVNEKLASTAEHNWDLSCLRWMGNGAEAVVGQTTQRFLELLAPYGLKSSVVSPGYGMSETTSGIAHSNDFYHNMNRQFVQVGAPIPGISLRIVDEKNELVPEGKIGLLQVKGETVTAGYYQQPELNEEIFTADGWFNTGDLGFLSAGRLTITGRQKDVMIINGVNYYNHDIETVVEAIANVTISYTAACGVKDSNEQEQIAIFFNTNQKQDKLRELINQIRKAVFEQIGIAPAYIIPVTKDAIPKTAIGKIQRSQLGQRFAAGEFNEVVEEVAESFNQRDLSQQELPSNAIEQQLVEVWKEVLNLATVSVNDNFFELGGNSLLLMQVLSKLTPEHNHLSAVTLFQYPTISALADYLNCDRESVAIQQGKRRGELRRQATVNKDVAIIGMSCRFPGANNIEEFWHNLCNGVESISFFEDAEILDSGVDQELLNNPNYVKASPILDDIAGFDADFWGYSPKEAQLLDPQQRLFLECAWSSLEDAGYDPFTYKGEIALYGGAATNTYLLNNIYPNRHTIDEQDDLKVINLSSMGGFQASTANDKDYLTTRISYKLNLTGSSVNVQTACSTSLVTVHLACQSLINSECDLALAGGVSVHSPQKMGYLYQEGMILSPDGHCRAFDESAGGTIFGSGAGMVVLKLLDKAIEDGDRIYGIVKGSAVNNDGGTKVGYFAPNVDGQTRAVAEALAYADIPPQSVSYIEAHGTGTKLGDPIEIKALTQAYHDDTRKIGYCAVGSVKTNVGHLQMASGIVGLIKTTLCLYHQKIPASLHFNNPNPQINFERSPFYINTQLQDWKSDNYPRRAGVNSLGIGGTNAHLILEEFTVEKSNKQQLPGYLLTLSAKTEPALQELVKSYQDYLRANGCSPLRDICFTSNIGRYHFDYRLGVVARDKQELAAKLNQIYIVNRIQNNNKIAFLFTGQGSQYVGMAQQLYNTQPVFKENCDRCLEILQPDYDKALLEVFIDLNENYLAQRRKDAKKSAKIGITSLYTINETQYTQPLLFTIEYSLAQMWLSWGIKPDVVMGHSIGEYVAACLAGVFSLEDALKLVSARSKLIQSLPTNGAMLAVFCDQEKIDFVLNKNISIAAYNGSHIVLSGLKVDIDNIIKELESSEIKTQLLNVNYAFHSPLMQPIIEDFEKVAKTINYSLPQILMISNITGELANEPVATPQYWTDHILKPVQFAKSIKYLDRQVSIFLEVGTKPTLTGMAQSISDNKLFLYSLNPKHDDWLQILEALSQLYIAGVDINWSEVSKNYNGQKISLPTYPFQRQRYWFDIPKPDIIRQYRNNTLQTTHPLLGKPLSSPLKQTIFQSHLQSNSITWLQDHCLANKPVLPGTAYLEMVIASGVFQFKTKRLTIKDVAIDSPLYIKESYVPEIQLILSPEQDTAACEVYSFDNDNEQWQLNSSGQVLPLEATADKLQLEVIKSWFKNLELDVTQYYQQCQQRGINYGKSFQGIKQLWANENEALGLIELPNHLNSNEYYFHPALLDSCLQILFAALPSELSTATYIPVGLDKLDLYSLPGNKVWSYLELEQDSKYNTGLSAKIQLYNDYGDLVAKLTGLKSQAVNSQPRWQNWLYQQQWIQQPLSSKSSLAIETGTWLIFADSTGIGNKLLTLLELQQQQCHLVTRHIIKDNPEAFQSLIQQHQDLAGVIYLCSLDEIEDWRECESYLYLVQALIQHNDNPPLWFVTRNAQPVDNYQLTSAIKQSCLWGMQKAIALEHPELLCVGIDLDRNSTNNEAETIFQEICAVLNEQVGYRNNQRYVARLVRFDKETKRQGDEETRRRGDKETGRLGDKETGRENSTEFNLQLEINDPGNLDSLQWKSISRQQPQDHEIEIEVKATGLNFRDVMVALDLYPDETKFLGLECAGIVTALGKEVNDFKLGDAVIAISDNSFSRYLTVNSLLAIPKPESLSYEEAATIPVTFLTAYYTLIYLARIQPGEKVLIHSAAGGVGLAAIQIAQQQGAEIFATASTPKWELLRSMGVKNIMNSRSLDFAEEIVSATDGKGVDVILNSLSGEFISKSVSVLNDRGHFIEIGKQGIWSKQDVAEVKPNINYFIIDLWRITQDQPELIQQMLGDVLSQFATEKLKPLPHTIFSSDKIIDAFRYMQQGKHQGKIIITPSPRHPITPLLPHFDGTYLITGGMGAIGLEVAQWLTTKGIKNIVLLGRSAVKPELQSKLQKIQGDAQVNLIKADIADTNQLAQALSQIESTLPPLRGVIHCAGVTSDRTILKQDWSSFSQVLAPKVQGAWNLHLLTQKYDLESFILFSSASSLVGSPGQANYCAANAFLDALAHGRRRLGLPASAINWGAWQNTGLAADTQIIESLKQKGIGSIKPTEGIEILEQLLLHSPTQIGVIPIDWNVWNKNNSAIPFYNNFIDSHPISIANLDFKQQLLNVEASQRQGLLIEQISQQVANILGIKNINQIDLELGFAELELDSLGSVELRNKLQSSYNLKLSATVIFDYSNVNKLANYLLKTMFNKNVSEQNIDLDNDLNQINNLLETEAESLLIEQLKNFNF